MKNPDRCCQISPTFASVRHVEDQPGHRHDDTDQVAQATESAEAIAEDDALEAELATAGIGAGSADLGTDGSGRS